MPKASTIVKLRIHLELGTQVKTKDEDGGGGHGVNLRENCWATGHNMASERPRGGLELEFTWRRPSGNYN
jgi:hypothetical protein